jgi:hypothetical protein
VRYYPPKVFKGLVPRIEGLIADGRLRASREVREEIEHENDGLRNWIKAQDSFFVESDATIQGIVKQLMETYYNPEKPDKGINGADPFVVAVAAVQKPELWSVVSGEKPGSVENPKIPWVCRQFKPVPIRSITFLEFVIEEGWELN